MILETKDFRVMSKTFEKTQCNAEKMKNTPIRSERTKYENSIGWSEKNGVSAQASLMRFHILRQRPISFFCYPVVVPFESSSSRSSNKC